MTIITIDNVKTRIHVIILKNDYKRVLTINPTPHHQKKTLKSNIPLKIIYTSLNIMYTKNLSHSRKKSSVDIKNPTENNKIKPHFKTPI